ncbi:MAG: patatin-like phospholipase family protein [Brasilonema sp.]
MTFKLAVLSIDGGGIRGIVPAMILAKIEEKTKKPIHELFDLIAGTSTGGILSLGLVKPNKDNEAEFSAEDLVKLYTDERNKIFKKRKIFDLPFDKWPFNNLLLFRLLESLRTSLDLQISPEELIRSKYTRDEKEKVIKSRLGKTPLNKALTEVIITSYAINKRIPLLFTSNPDKEELKSNNFHRICSGYTMYNAAMATSAAPTFFKPYSPEYISSEREKYLFIDGGVIANNPTYIAIIEAMKSYEIKIGTIGLQEILVVSLGTGAVAEPFSKETEKWGLIQWVKPLINIVFSGQSEIITYQMEHLLSKDKQYYRFQFNCEKFEKNKLDISSLPEKCNVNEAMDDVREENIQELQKAAKKLIGEEYSKLENLCDVLSASLNTRELLKKKKI